MSQTAWGTHPSWILVREVRVELATAKVPLVEHRGATIYRATYQNDAAASGAVIRIHNGVHDGAAIAALASGFRCTTIIEVEAASVPFAWYRREGCDMRPWLTAVVTQSGCARGGHRFVLVRAARCFFSARASSAFQPPPVAVACEHCGRSTIVPHDAPAYGLDPDDTLNGALWAQLTCACKVVVTDEAVSHQQYGDRRSERVRSRPRRYTGGAQRRGSVTYA